MQIVPLNHIICQNLFQDLLGKTPLSVLLSTEFDTAFGAFTLRATKEEFISSISEKTFENTYKVPGYTYKIKVLKFKDDTIYVYIKESGHFQTIEEYLLPQTFFKEYFHLTTNILAEIEKALESA